MKSIFKTADYIIQLYIPYKWQAGTCTYTNWMFANFTKLLHYQLPLSDKVIMSNITTNMCNQMSYNLQSPSIKYSPWTSRLFLPDIEIYLANSTISWLVWQYKLTVGN